jgi:hypothetical protein
MTPLVSHASQAQAAQEKELGNEAYKKKEFETAIGHYNKAIELNPSDMTFLTNRAAVFFEQVGTKAAKLEGLLWRLSWLHACLRQVHAGHTQRSQLP